MLNGHARKLEQILILIKYYCENEKKNQFPLLQIWIKLSEFCLLALTEYSLLL